VLLTLLFDLLLAACLGCGPYPAQPAAVYQSYAPTPCTCPKDSPCKKGCQTDDCCCKGSSCAQQAVYAPVSAWTSPASAAYGPRCCAAPVMVNEGNYQLPYTPMPPAPRLYEVELKVGKDLCPKLMLPIGTGSIIHHLPASPKFEGVCQIGLYLSDAEDGCVKVDMHLGQVRGSGGFPTLVVSKGTKKVHPDTSTNIILSGDDPEPVSVGLFVKPVEVPTVTVLPAPLPCPCPVACDMPVPAPMAAPPPVRVPCAPPMPPIAFVPPPAPTPPAYGYPPQYAHPMPGPICPPDTGAIPEPMPVPPPAPPLTRCVATVPAKVCSSSAHVKLVRCCHKSLVAMKSDDVCMTGVRMTIDKGACGSLTVVAGKKHVHIKGKKWKAQADSVEILADGHIVLCGHVKLISDKIGVCASVKAEKLCVQVKDGKFISVGSKE
jgi:hypothetical protein